MLPTTDALKEGLAVALHNEGLNGHSLTLVRREPTPYSTSFPCEIVTCRIGRVRRHRLFCKYAAGVDHTSHGHRGGVAYEIATYRHVLARGKQFRPQFYGGYTVPDTGQHWLFLEYLDGSLRVGKFGDAGAMAKTARWIAQFHLANQGVLSNKRLRFLKRYDKDYYLGWACRTAQFAPSPHSHSRWFVRLRGRAEEFLAPLLALRPTIIHGEYYQHNILLHRGKVCPIDWETAAVGEGLIDLATLTDDWDTEIVERCTRTYVQTRWPKGAPPEFEGALRAARLYLAFRWLGDNEYISRRQSENGNWMRLRNLAAELEQT